MIRIQVVEVRVFRKSRRMIQVREDTNENIRTELNVCRIEEMIKMHRGGKNIMMGWEETCYRMKLEATNRKDEEMTENHGKHESISLMKSKR